MAVSGTSNYDSVRAKIREEILGASIPSQRLVQVIELIDVCRVGNDLEAIKEVRNRLAELLKTNAALERCKECCRDCDCLATSANETDCRLAKAKWDLELYIDETNIGPFDSRTPVINGRERFHLAVGSRHLRICYFSGPRQTGICLTCVQQHTLKDIGHYFPLVYLIPHIYVMYKRIFDRSGNSADGPAITARPSVSLTPREADVLRWIAVGKTNWEIGQILGLSERTVKFHLYNSFGKLNVVNRTQAVIKARECGALNDQTSPGPIDGIRPLPIQLSAEREQVCH
jgi:DNA-binding CsgD family transcriptional regulator